MSVVVRDDRGLVVRRCPVRGHTSPAGHQPVQVIRRPGSCMFSIILYGKPKKKVLFLMAVPLRPYFPFPSSLMAVGTFFFKFFLNGQPFTPLPRNGTAIKKNVFCGFPILKCVFFLYNRKNCKNWELTASFEFFSAFEWWFYFFRGIQYCNSNFKFCVKCVILKFRFQAKEFKTSTT